MRLFVSEYVCSGAWPDAALPESLAREGRAMLLALLQDAAQLPGLEVQTTWDHRLGPFPVAGVSALTVNGPVEEQSAFDRLAGECAATYVIAPELDDLLARRCRRVTDAGGASLNSSLPAIAVCSDKLQLAQRLEEADIPTVPTQRLNSTAAIHFDFPVVVKPRFGAGSHETYLVETGRRLDEIRLRFADRPETEEAIVQPFVKGMSVSVVAIVKDQGRGAEFWPVVEQLLSNDGRFTYLGGRTSRSAGFDDAIRQVARDATSAAPGLCGYVGIDMLVPYPRGEPLLVEINPRLTTSYVGYRALTHDNLAERVLRPWVCGGDVAWNRDELLFTSSGSVIHQPRPPRERRLSAESGVST